MPWELRNVFLCHFLIKGHPCARQSIVCINSPMSLQGESSQPCCCCGENISRRWEKLTLPFIWRGSFPLPLWEENEVQCISDINCPEWDHILQIKGSVLQRLLLSHTLAHAPEFQDYSHFWPTTNLEIPTTPSGLIICWNNLQNSVLCLEL